MKVWLQSVTINHGNMLHICQLSWQLASSHTWPRWQEYREESMSPVPDIDCWWLPPHSLLHPQWHKHNHNIINAVVYKASIPLIIKAIRPTSHAQRGGGDILDRLTSERASWTEHGLDPWMFPVLYPFNCYIIHQTHTEDNGHWPDLYSNISLLTIVSELTHVRP